VLKNTEFDAEFQCVEKVEKEFKWRKLEVSRESREKKTKCG
jgi:hypothetical protein